METFFSSADYVTYLNLLIEFKEMAGVEFWAYCLMPNHVHLVVVPADKDSLATLFRQVHRQYTRGVNLREHWKGHLWQERYHSFVMDERHLLATVRYTELNPVRARLCDFAEEWPWSSVHAHLAGESDAVVSAQPMLQRVSEWASYLATEERDSDIQRIRSHGRSGRPAGDSSFLAEIQALTGTDLSKQKPGPRLSTKCTARQGAIK